MSNGAANGSFVAFAVNHPHQRNRRIVAQLAVQHCNTVLQQHANRTEKLRLGQKGNVALTSRRMVASQGFEP